MGQPDSNSNTVPLQKKKPQDNNGQSTFDGLLAAVGNTGPFQKRLLYGFFLPFNCVLPFALMVMMFIVVAPDHWCHVPGRETTNYTAEQWKELTIPREATSTGEDGFSKCNMYNTSAFSADMDVNATAVIQCQHGWDYDDTWYKRTVSSKENWVCDRSHIGSTVLSIGEVGSAFGSAVLGYMADKFGRKPIFFLTVMIRTVFRVVAIFSTALPTIMIAANFASALSMPVIYQSPLIICLEYSRPQDRGLINMMACLAWVVGMSALPFFVWWVGDYVYIGVITIIPLAMFLFTYWWLPESARWLVSHNRCEEAGKILKRIADVNGTTVPDDYTDKLEDLYLEHANAKKSKLGGIFALFTASKTLARMVLTINFCWVMNLLGYMVLQLGFSNMKGNPFVNNFFLSIIEFPAYVLGKYLVDSVGRRWTQTGFLVLEGCFCLAVTTVITTPHLEWLSTAFTICAKFCVSLSFFAIYLQATEIYPTPLRNTGLSFGALVAHLFSIVSPYVVYLGTFDIRYPFAILAVSSILGGFVASFLPETLNQELPETLEESDNFGKNQPYFSIRPVQRKNSMVKATDCK